MSAVTKCRTWSQTSDQRFTGLCSMKMLLETEANMQNGCPICVTPVATDPPPEEP